MNIKKLLLILASITLILGSCKSNKKSSAVEQKLQLDAQARLQELIDRQNELLNAAESEGYTKDDIANDELFMESETYRDMSQRALDSKSYQVALDKANAGHESLDKYMAARSIRKAKKSYEDAKKAGLEQSNAEQMNQAATLISDAENAYNNKDYKLALTNAEQAQTLLDGMLRDKPSNDTYTVVSGDCLWRIAKKPKIYNNSHAWPKIYMANKHKFKQPDNPHLIFPDQIFTIPRD